MTVESTGHRDIYINYLGLIKFRLIHSTWFTMAVPAPGSLSVTLPCRKLVESEEAPVEQSTLLWCILGRDIAGDPSLDQLRSSDDAGSVWIDASVEDEGPPATRLALRRARNTITTPHVRLPPRRGSEHSGARVSPTDHRRSIGAAGSARIGTSGEIKIRPRRPI